MKNYALLVLLALVVFACKKDDEVIIEPPAPAPVYMPMEVGNYWVYQSFRIDSLGETPTDRFDSLVIIKDTMIRDHRYYIYEGTMHTIHWRTLRILRDSSGFYVNHHGDIFFTDQKGNGEVYYEKTDYMGDDADTSVYIKAYNEEVHQQITFPIGTFDVLNRINDYAIFPQNTNFPDSLKYRKTNNYFIENIGQASYSVLYAMSGLRFDKRLIRYRIITAIGD